MTKAITACVQMCILEHRNKPHLYIKISWCLTLNRDIRKVRKRQHQYPEFGHTMGDIQKKPAKKYITIQGGGETQKTISRVLSCLSFMMSASTAAT